MSTAPYPGLRPFREDETDIFFGREAHTDQLLRQLGREGFLAVLGPSGSGKSSLVYTGLLDGLHSGLLAEAGSRWAVAALRPGGQPFARLAGALLAHTPLGQAYARHFSDPDQAQAFLLADLQRGPRSLHEILATNPLPAGTHLLLLVDQFEEIFRYRQQDPAEASAFVDLLLESVQDWRFSKNRQSSPLCLVLTMRSDFLGDCAAFPRLPEAINHSLFLTPRLSRDQLRQAITGPAEVFGGQIDPLLLNQLLNDVGDDPDQLPVLQHALMRMWDVAAGQNETCLNLSHYQRIGGLRDALSQHAEEALAELPPAQRPLAEPLFRCLCEGRAGGDTRRPARLDEVAAVAGCDWRELLPVVEVFRAPGRAFLTPPVPVRLAPDSVLDISHESLIRQWRRLHDWVRREAEAGETYRRLEDSAVLWRQGRAALLQEPELGNLLGWRGHFRPTPAWAARYGRPAAGEPEPFSLAMSYLDQSRVAYRHEQHKKRRLRMAIWGMAALTIVVGFGFQVREARIHADNAAWVQGLEQQRTGELFESRLTHAALLAEGEDYARAREVLQQSLPFDESIPLPRRHAHDLLAGNVELMGGQAAQVYPAAGAPLMAVALAPDGGLLAVGGERGTLVLFEVDSGHIAQRLTGTNAGNSGTVRALAFDAQGRLYSAGDEGTILRWARQGAEYQQDATWQAPATVRALAVSPDGARLASGGDDNAISLWDTASAQVEQVLRGHQNKITALAFSPDGQRLISAAHDQTARVWEDGKERFQLHGHNEPVFGVAISPDGKLAATSSADRTVLLWNLGNSQPIKVLRGHQYYVAGLAFSPDGRQLASASMDRSVRLWDVDNGVLLRVLQGHQAGVGALAWRGRRVYSVSLDGTARAWDSVSPAWHLLDMPGEPASVALAPDASWAVVGFADGSLRAYELPGGELLWEKPGAHDDKDVLRVTFSPDGRLLASAGYDYQLKLWQASKRSPPGLVRTFSGHTVAVHAAVFSNDGQWLASAGYDGQVGLFRVDGTQQRLFPAHAGKVSSVAFSPDQTRLLSVGGDGSLRLWKLDSADSLPEELLHTQDMLTWTTLSPDARWAVAVGLGMTVQRVPLPGNSAAPATLTGHEQTIFRAIFTPDGAQLATVAGDATLRLWDVEQAAPLFSLRLPANPFPPSPLWDFDFRCQAALQACWAAVPLTRGKLAVYRFPYGSPPE